MSNEELEKIYTKAIYSGWDRSSGAKLVLKLIAEIKRLREAN